MKKMVIALVMLGSISMGYCKEGVRMEKYGFIFEDGKALYYDSYMLKPTGHEVIRFERSENEIKAIKGEYIYAASVQIQDDKIVIDSVNKSRPGNIVDTKKIKYKIENKTGYVSADGKKWEKLEIVSFNDTGKFPPAVEVPRGGEIQGNYPIVYVYFKCSFFSGEYLLGFDF